MRAPGMAWRRLPLFSWAATVICYVLLVVGPVMLAALTMLTIDRHFDGVFFESGEGGSPLLYEHLVYIFMTGIYAIVVLFAAGVISEILPTMARKPIFSHRAVAGSMVAIGVLTPLAWMQNMYSAPIPEGFQLHGDGRRARARGPDRHPVLRLDRDAVARHDPDRARRCSTPLPPSRRWAAAWRASSPTR